MNKHTIYDLKKFTKVGGVYYSLHKIYILPKFIVSFSIEVNETSLASEKFSIIISKFPIETEKSQNKQNFMRLNSPIQRGKSLIK